MINASCIEKNTRQCLSHPTEGFFSMHGATNEALPTVEA
jgi:hypothetical protein